MGVQIVNFTSNRIVTHETNVEYFIDLVPVAKHG